MNRRPAKQCRSDGGRAAWAGVNVASIADALLSPSPTPGPVRTLSDMNDEELAALVALYGPIAARKVSI